MKSMIELNHKNHVTLIWDIAELLRGDYRQSEYGKVVLPFTLLRRLDCVLSHTKEKVLSEYEKHKDKSENALENILNSVSGYKFHNRSKFDFEKLISDPNHIALNFRNYINGFSRHAREILDYFDIMNQLDRLEKSDLLLEVTKRFKSIDLHSNKVSNVEMGYIFEELIRKFAEASNETAGEHFTPREVIRLMVYLLFNYDTEIFKEGIIKTVYDPACGTGGMLSVSDDHVNELNHNATLVLFGQEINPESYAICKSDMLIKGQEANNIKFGNSFTNDGLENERFDYMLSNPPFGVDWKKYQDSIQKEFEQKGFGGRFGPGLPRVSDGSLLFLLHMISKMKQDEKGSRIAIVFNGSPLFTGSAGQGESEIRKWIIENDMLEAIIALPKELFYNTGIATYIWVLSNRKQANRKGKIQLINAVDFYEKMSRSLGNKRNKISEDQIDDITKIYGNFQESKNCKIFDNKDFGYNRVTIERPMRNENGEIIVDSKGTKKPDSSLRDYENIPLNEDIQQYFEREVLPHVPDAWIDETKTKVGYEVNFTKYFYKFTPLRSLEEIKADILALEKDTENLLEEILQ